MSAPELGDFRALLAHFRRSDLHDLWVRAPDWSVFLARPGGAANPAFQPTPPAPAAETPAEHVVGAAHLGVVASLLPPGSRVATGDHIAELSVLDEARPVLADRPGTVRHHLAQVGTLVEYGHGLLAIA